MLAVGNNSTAIMAALPAMQSELALSHATVQWAVNSYLLASACFIVLGGKAADRFGAAQSSAAGSALFGIASLGLALAPDGAVVLAARALQGLAAALAVAGTLAAVSAGASERERARSIGAWSGFVMLGFSVGPLVGGALSHYAGWRTVFWLNVPAMAMAAGLLLADRHGGGVPARQAERTDWLGVVLLAVFMTALIFGLHALPEGASAPWAAIAPLAVAALALTGLLRVEARSKEPLLDLAFFARRNFALAVGVQFVSMFNIMTLLLYYNLFAQAAQGLAFSAIEAGLSLLPLSLALFGVARAAPRLATRFGLARVMAAGMLLTTLGCAVVGIAVAGAGMVMLTLGLLAIGAGIALPYASGPRLGLAALPADAAGQASGILNSCSFLGGTVGVTAGGIALGIAGFPGVLAVIALSALIGAGLCLRIDHAESALQP